MKLSTLQISFAVPPPFVNQNALIQSDPYENTYRLQAPALERYDPLSFFRDSIRQIPTVEQVRFAYQAIPSGKHIVHFYTVIDADDKELRKKIYGVEMQLLRQFTKEHYSFDFHLIARRGRKATELASPDLKILFQRQ